MIEIEAKLASNEAFLTESSDFPGAKFTLGQWISDEKFDILKQNGAEFAFVAYRREEPVYTYRFYKWVYFTRRHERDILYRIEAEKLLSKIDENGKVVFEQEATKMSKDEAMKFASDLIQKLTFEGEKGLEYVELCWSNNRDRFDTTREFDKIVYEFGYKINSDIGEVFTLSVDDYIYFLPASFETTVMDGLRPTLLLRRVKWSNIRLVDGKTISFVSESEAD